MNKSFLMTFGVIVVGFLLVVGFVFTRRPSISQPTNTMGQVAQVTNNKLVADDDSQNDTMVGVEEKVGEGVRYLPYTQQDFATNADVRRVLFFYANWCPTCRPADADFASRQSEIPQDVRVYRVNYNDTETDQEEKELAQKYGVTYQHTFVQIDADANEVAKWNGGQVDELLTNIK